MFQFDESISELANLVGNLQGIIGTKPISKKVRDGFSKFNKAFNDYKLSINDDNLEKISDSAKMVAVYGQVIGQAIDSSSLDSEIKESGNRVLNCANQFRSYVEDSPLETYSLSDADRIDVTEQVKDFRSVRKNLEQISNSHLLFDERVKKLLAESEQRAVKLEDRIDSIEQDYHNKLTELSSLYDETLKNVQEKNTQLNEVLGEVSSRVIAQDYEKSAENEMKTANWLRRGSICCMALIVAVVGYSFFESIQSQFDLQGSGFRLVLAFLLSVPAAYLARESTKHRLQQYIHLQTALDLKAISPYLASLPEDEQHKIKAEMANKIFATRDLRSHSSESYPINVHELVIEILKKLEFNKTK